MKLDELLNELIKEDPCRLSLSDRKDLHDFVVAGKNELEQAKNSLSISNIQYQGLANLIKYCMQGQLGK